MKLLKYFILVWITTSLLVSCGSNDTNSKVDQSKLPILNVKVQKAGLGLGDQLYSFTGKLEANNFAQLSTRVMGQIISLDVEEGDQVYAGQTLVQIKSADIQATVSRVDAGIKEAQAALKNVEINYQRIKTLYEKESATRKEFDDITAQYEMAKARLEAARLSKIEAEEMLNYALITAPFDGYVVKKYSSRGSLANPGQPILEIEGAKQFKVIAKVPESEINLFQTNDEVMVNIDAIKDQSFTGKVNLINRSSNLNQGQFEISVLLNDQEDALDKIKSGMFAKVLLSKGKSKALTISKKHLIERGQLTGLFTINKQNQAMLRWVRTGKETGEEVEILSGLAPGEVYITAYKGKLMDGQPVKIIK